MFSGDEMKYYCIDKCVIDGNDIVNNVGLDGEINFCWWDGLYEGENIW